MPERRIPVASILLEASFVVLGVFLALVLNEWRAEAHERDRAALARASLVDEVRANAEAMRQAHAYHEGLIDTLRAWAGPSPPAPAVFSRGFISPVSVRTTAWDAATAADAVAAMAYDEVLLLSGAYAAQQSYVASIEQAGRVIYQAVYDRGPDGVAADYPRILHLVYSLYYLEERLLETYETTLARLDGASPRRAAEAHGR